MLNANGNYIGFGNPRLLQITGNHESFQQDGYQVIKFYYESGSVVAGNGTGSFTLPDQKEVEFLVIGGGGSSGIPRREGSYNFFNTQYQGASAGGGAGTLITGSFLGLKGMQYNVVVGNGGFRNWGFPTASTNDPAQDGASSLLSGISAAGSMSILAPGGGYGGSTNTSGSSGINGNNGGSGGGAGMQLNAGGGFITLGNSGSAVAGTVNGVISYQSLQNNGGAAADSGGGINSLGVFGGGGGSSTVGGNANFAGATGGNGGTGTFNAMSGSGRYFAGGGAGGYLIDNSMNAYYGQKGLGGGGGAITAGATGSYLDVDQGKGEEQTGGGGAGGWSGGSGVIIVRYKLSQERL